MMLKVACGCAMFLSLWATPPAYAADMDEAKVRMVVDPDQSVRRVFKVFLADLEIPAGTKPEEFILKLADRGGNSIWCDGRGEVQGTNKAGSTPVKLEIVVAP